MKKPGKAVGAEPAREGAPVAASLSEAQRLAATILECLAGLRTPTTASEALKISLPRYYQLETRALQGMVHSLAPRAKGKQASLAVRVRELEKELESARRACSRQEALVRITQRTLGLTSLPKTEPRPTIKDGKKRKSKRPSVRAMRAAKTLHSMSEAPGSEPQEVAPPTAVSNGSEGAT
jgi:hypothetical protein